MPTKARIVREKRQRAVAEEWNLNMPPMPEWMRNENPRKGNLWALFHPSIRRNAKTEAAEGRLANGNKVGLQAAQKANRARRDTALIVAARLRAKYPKEWTTRGGGKQIAFCEGIAVSTVNRYRLLLKRNSQGR